MTYQALARKWRPHHFKEMIGQENILRMLENALSKNRIHHAYLFTGTRGVGKTTIARILAKCLNCEQGVTAQPCGSCPTCQAINSGTFLDLYEVDAASRTKVEDTRELLENVLYPPTQGRFKIYLIDEVHMLSNHSFNALLKTLEEPPAHVKFMLATTDPERLPITILSRCLQFHLKRIPKEKITSQLEFICHEEGISYEQPALYLLAQAADGSMRDALSLLDQAMAYSDQTIKVDDIKQMLGCVTSQELYPLLHALIAHDGAALFNYLASLHDSAPDFKQLLDELISIFQKLAIAQVVPDAVSLDDQLKAISQQFDASEIQLYYQIALLGRRDMSLTPQSYQGFEMTLLRMLAFQPEHAEPTVQKNNHKQVVAPAKIEAVEKVEKNEQAEASTSEITINWRELLPKLELSGMAYALAANCTLEKATDECVTLSLSHTHQPMLSPKLIERLIEALSRHFKKSMKLFINTTTESIATPLKQQQEEQNEKFKAAKETILNNEKIKKLIDLYDATVEVSLL